MSRALKELRGLVPFSWDARVEEHPAGEAASQHHNPTSYGTLPQHRDVRRKTERPSGCLVLPVLSHSLPARVFLLTTQPRHLPSRSWVWPDEQARPRCGTFRTPSSSAPAEKPAAAEAPAARAPARRESLLASAPLRWAPLTRGCSTSLDALLPDSLAASRGT